MQKISGKKISEIVREDYRTAEVFRNHGINYCCSGAITLAEACNTRQIEVVDLINELDMATREPRIVPASQYWSWNVDFMADYIINVHHVYLYTALTDLEKLFSGFMKNHQKNHPELDMIYSVFRELSELLIKHNKYEEEITFPYIKHLEVANRRKETYGGLFVKTLKKPLTMVTKDHEIIQESLQTLQQLTNNYVCPENSCTSNRVLYHKLKEMHHDLVHHKHLEMNILFLKAEEIERELLQGLNNEV